ncbi:hypothetical protein B0T18DRAFT_225703 [Schizothecium vesticola]|uniref:Uncharacterized protein n=1 Tax=Schizothecium vesticola TaxID=314040 RepID=A0AA40EKW5_9PEZI|nr:hypothetical protein B0T18DRAFT_225703 [Schizothecium vesticola]
MMERKSLPLPNHKHQRGSACLPAVSQVKQAGYYVPFPSYHIDSEGRWPLLSGLWRQISLAADSDRAEVVSYTREQSSQLSASVQEASAIDCSDLFGRRERFGGQPTGHCIKPSLLLGAECCTTTWMESLLGLSGTGPRSFERLFFSLVPRPLLLAVSPQSWRVSDGCRKEGLEGVLSEFLRRLPCICVRCLLVGNVYPSVIRLLHALLGRFPSPSTQVWSQGGGRIEPCEE